MLTIPFISLYPDLESNLEDLADARSTHEWSGEHAGERVARFAIEIDHIHGAVTLAQPLDAPWGGRATFEGASEVDLAMALTTVLAMLPLELCLAMTRWMASENDRRTASVILQHLRGWVDPRHLDAMDAALGGRSSGHGPEAPADMPWLSLSIVPLEPLPDTLARLSTAFRHAALAVTSLQQDVEAYRLDDADGSDARVELIVDTRWNAGCAYFEGHNLASFATRLARTFRYLPRELAVRAIRECERPWDRATGAAALGLSALHPRGVPALALAETLEALKTAAGDPDDDVRGMAMLYTLLLDARQAPQVRD